MAEAHMLHRIRRRVMDLNKKDKVAVVVPHDGKPSRVFELDTYLARKEGPKKHRPWEHRKDRPATLRGLPITHGTVRGPIGRSAIYE